MANRNFDASFSTKRIRDLNVAQNIFIATETGQRIGNPVTALNDVSLVNQYRPGVQTFIQRGNVASEASVSIGGIANRIDDAIKPKLPKFTLPSRPLILGIDPEDRQLIIRFTPSNSSSSVITNYKYSTNNGLTFRELIPPQITSPINIYGLLNGSAYDIILKAITADGDGEATLSTRAIPATFPSKPASLVSNPGNANARLTFVAPNNGGSDIIRYEYSFDNINFRSTGSNSSPVDISGLVNGNNTTVYVRAVNSRGHGPSSDPISFIPSTIPDPPSFSTVSTSDQSINVNFNENFNGGASIIDYQYSTDGINYNTILSRSFNLSGLTNGQAVPIYIRSRNANGFSSPVVSSYTPATIPSAPSFGLVDTGNGSIIVNFTGSGSDGGSPITSYQYSTDGITYNPLPNTTDRSFTISGLTNGSNYTVRFRAVNTKGNSSIVTTSATPATIPDPPSFSTISISSGSVTVNFNDGFNGGSNILDYEYSTDGITFNTILSRSFTLTGLTNGSAVPIYVRARNNKGRGTVATTTATASTIPDAPNNVSSIYGNSSLTITITDGFTGGSPITGYKYRISPSYTTEYSTSSNPFTITGLTNGTSYTIRVYAVNANGTSSSYTTVTGIPSTIPNAPTSLVATPGNGTISIVVTNGSTGGSAITGYTYYLSNDNYVTSYVTSSSPFTITGLTNSTSYTVRIYAMNINGNSSNYTEVTATPIGLPEPPTNLVTTPGTNYIRIAFTPGNNAGSSITNYQYSTDNGNTFKAFSPSKTTSPVDITTLSNSSTAITIGTQYTILLKAVNANGISSASTSVIGRTLITVVQSFTTVGTTTWTAPATTTSVEYLVVGGGGGSGSSGFGRGGGGGGGGMVRSGSSSITSNTNYTIIVGNGGSAGRYLYNGTTYSETSSGNGEKSQFNTIISLGGGGGAYSTHPTLTDGLKGNMTIVPNTASTGGNGSLEWTGVSSFGTGGGGGGAGSDGSNGTRSYTGSPINFYITGGNGGTGITSSITGTSISYGYGGQGGGNNAPTKQTGYRLSTNKGGGAYAASGDYYNTNSTVNGAQGEAGIVVLKYTY